MIFSFHRDPTGMAHTVHTYRHTYIGQEVFNYIFNRPKGANRISSLLGFTYPLIHQTAFPLFF